MTTTNQPTRLVIFGGRSFDNEILMRETLQQLNESGWIPDDLILICGLARGADSLGKRIFESVGLPIEFYKPDWNTFGKSAGYLRNTDMAQVADKGIGFWDGQSRGTQHMINIMQRLNKPLHIIKY